ncbi:MAG: fibronectin type III domain-containing protein [Anaerolineae bacterium]
MTPSKTGYSFTPADTDYSNVTANETAQDYTATAITYTIAGNAGVPEATLSYTDGTAKTATADGTGNYSFTVSYNWSGTVTPSKMGYSFTPASKSYSNVLANSAAQNYTAALLTYTITGNTAVGGVTLTYAGAPSGVCAPFSDAVPGACATPGYVQRVHPSTVTSDASGNYSITVSHGWSGTVIPARSGYTFTPASKPYTNVTANQAGQGYTAVGLTYTISGNAGLAGATLSYADGGVNKTATTDAGGEYSFTVSYNWSGTVKPYKEGYAFTPTSKTYANTTTDQAGQDYTAALIPPPADPDAAPGNDTIVTTWQPSLGAQGYLLDVAADPEFKQFVSGFQGRDIGDQTQFNVGGLRPLTEYYYRVRAYFDDGNVSTYSEPVAATTQLAVVYGIVFHYTPCTDTICVTPLTTGQ